MDGGSIVSLRVLVDDVEVLPEEGLVTVLVVVVVLPDVVGVFVVVVDDEVVLPDVVGVFVVVVDDEVVLPDVVGDVVVVPPAVETLTTFLTTLFVGVPVLDDEVVGVVLVLDDVVDDFVGLVIVEDLDSLIEFLVSLVVVGMIFLSSLVFFCSNNTLALDCVLIVGFESPVLVLPVGAFFPHPVQNLALLAKFFPQPFKIFEKNKIEKKLYFQNFFFTCAKWHLIY